MAAKKKPTARKKGGKSNLPAVVGEQAVVESDLHDQLLKEQMEGIKVTFPILKILHAGALSFDLGDNRREEEFEGIIIFRHPANADWKEKYSGTGSPPDCSSLDGVIGEGDPGGSCADCQKNEFGSADEGGGKHCKNTERFYILMSPEDEIPYSLIIPPTSLGPVASYVARCTGQRVALPMTFTKFSLKTAKGGGYEYSKLVLTKGDFLDKDEAKRILELRSNLIGAMRSKALDADDFDSPQGKNSGGRSDDWEPPTDEQPKSKKKSAGARGSARKKSKI